MTFVAIKYPLEKRKDGGKKGKLLKYDPKALACEKVTINSLIHQSMN